MRLIYIVGAPGVGKSTLMRGLTRGLSRVSVDNFGLPRDVLFRGEQPVGVELGRRRGTFSGTDALGMSIHPTALKWIAVTQEEVVLAEGQRLATRQFLRTALDAGRAVDLLWLDPPTEVAEARRRARGTKQNPTWVKAATTRAARLAAQAGPMGVRVTRLDGTGSPTEVEAQARESLELHEGLALA